MRLLNNRIHSQSHTPPGQPNAKKKSFYIPEETYKDTEEEYRNILFQFKTFKGEGYVKIISCLNEVQATVVEMKHTKRSMAKIL